MNQRFIPSLLIPEIYFPVKNEKGFTAELVERFAAEGFYKSFEIGDGFEKSERKRILKEKEHHNLIVTQWLTFLMDSNGLDVSSIDRDLRKESIKQIKEHVYLAAECGATNIAFVTGEDPGEALRLDAMEGLYESLCEISEEASKYDLKVLVEPLDRYAHKKRVVGPTDEAIQLLARVRNEYQNIGLAFDTAHAALNSEEISEALELAMPYVEQIHFSNAVLAKESELYGDYHMSIGTPGFLDVHEIASILNKADELRIKSEEGLRVAVEVRGTDLQDIHANEKAVRQVLEQGLSLVVI